MKPHPPMRRRIVAFLLAMGIPAAAAQVTDLEFRESPACRVNEIPLGQPARIEAKGNGARLEVKVAANFGCSTNAGKARVEEADGEIRLYADTILPGFPTPACKCTRHLEYRFSSASASRRIVFYRDGRVEGEGEVAR
jgi:hypothetical protein